MIFFTAFFLLANMSKLLIYPLSFLDKQHVVECSLGEVMHFTCMNTGIHQACTMHGILILSCCSDTTGGLSSLMIMFY